MNAQIQYQHQKVFYQVLAQITFTEESNTRVLEVPVFFLDADILGIRDSDHACQIARTMLSEIAQGKGTYNLCAVERIFCRNLECIGQFRLNSTVATLPP